MKRESKSGVLKKMAECFSSSDAVFVVIQNGMTVVETEMLRRKLADTSAFYFVSKNTLARLAVIGGKFEYLGSFFHGQTALIFSNDVVGTARVVCDYLSESGGKLAVVCAGHAGSLLSISDVETLAKLPGLLELRARLIAHLRVPMQRLAAVLEAPAARITCVLSAYAGK